MLGTLQTGFEFVASWAVSNSDPANLLLLGVVYWRLRRENKDLRDKVDRIDSRVKDLHNGQNGEK